MDLFGQIIAFGMLALLMFSFSIAFLQGKKPKIGLVFGCLELFSAVRSAGAWMYALRVSGKGDWFLFGILSYPLVGLICVAMFAVGFLCVAANVRGILTKD